MSVGTSHYDVQDTIVAIASPEGAGARGIVRLTGWKSLEIVAAVFKQQPADSVDTSGFHPTAARRYVGTVSFAIGQVSLDWPCELWLWPTKRTYTGQPSAEFHLLGAPIVLEKLLHACCQLGARLAGPGEFTMRAFLAGRMDLVQAEAVLGIIHAQDPDQLHAGLAQLAGGLSHPLQSIREQLIHLLAHLEAGLDFAEEDIEFISVAELTSQLTSIEATVKSTLEQLRSRNSLQLLPQILLVGPPNAGKSSLYNQLTDGENAIVSSTSGTTRDFLRCQLCFHDIEFELVDTAGLEHRLGAGDLGAGDLSMDSDHGLAENGLDIENMSERASLSQLQQADLVLLCCDPASPISWKHWTHLLSDRSIILLWTKSDLGTAPAELSKLALATNNFAQVQSISTKTGEGVAELKSALLGHLLVAQQNRREKTGSIGWRALEQLEVIAESLSLAIVHAQFGGNEELVAAELRGAVDALGKLVGTIYTDDLLDSIFSRFCIGK